MENYKRIVKELETVIETKTQVHGHGSIADIVKACEVLDPKFNRAFCSGYGTKFDEEGNLIDVDGFGLFKFLNYETGFFVTRHLIQVNGSLMEDTYTLSYVRDNDNLTGNEGHRIPNIPPHYNPFEKGKNSMNLEEYIDGARRTESSKQPLHADTTALGLTNRMLHGIIGISTEMGEIVEAYERTNIDLVNVAEEVGDAYWYTAVLMDELGIARVDAPVGVGALPASTLPKQLLIQSAEMLDLCKKTMFYGKEYNVDGLREQVSRFYITLGLFVDGLAEELDVTKEKIWTINLNKLKIRYPEKFSLSDAEVRDLQAERIVLETVK